MTALTCTDLALALRALQFTACNQTERPLGKAEAIKPTWSWDGCGEPSPAPRSVPAGWQMGMCGQQAVPQSSQKLPDQRTRGSTVCSKHGLEHPTEGRGHWGSAWAEWCWQCHTTLGFPSPHRHHPATGDGSKGYEKIRRIHFNFKT